MVRLIKPDWQLNFEEIVSRSTYLLKSAEWSDCEISVDDVQGEEVGEFKMKVHKLILSLASPIFSYMFYGNEVQEIKAIKIQNMNPQVLKSLITYMYTDEVILENLDTAIELYRAATIYKVPYVKQLSFDYVYSQLNVSNAMKMLTFAKAENESDLIEKALSYIRNNTMEILSEIDITEIPLSTISYVLNEDTMNIDDEMILFNVLKSYFDLHKDKQELSAYTPAIRDAVSKIRFLTMTSDRFLNGPATSGLITPEDNVLILNKMILLESDELMPEGFSTSTDKRNKEITPLYCTREKGIEELCYFEYDIANPDTCVTTFKVNKSIYVQGIVIPTQICSSIENPIYNDRVLATISYSMDGVEFSYPIQSKLKHKTPYNMTQKLYFDTPCIIKRNMICRITVDFHVTGYYPIGKLPKILKVDDWTFMFYIKPEIENRPGIIRSIIYCSE